MKLFTHEGEDTGEEVAVALEKLDTFFRFALVVKM